MGGAAPGICGGCAHAEVVRTARSAFILCGRWREEPGRFPRYPRLPVLACPGFAPREGPGPGTLQP
jgi:hypothetical protein